ncbi:MAG TPA: flagellar hook-associated protein FlgK, partial [Micropepsaceae bacterium]|nr:flagellar hook-associated protein FlgK [Micropepsaceae bacterium]
LSLQIPARNYVLSLEHQLPMALNGIISSGLTAIQTNSSAMRVVSDNIANVNTPGYVRRVAQQQTLAPGGVLSGVELSQVQRAVNSYLDREVLSASGNAASYDVQSSIMDQFNAALGAPGDGNSVGSRLDAIYASLGQASLDPSSLTMRLGALGQFDSLAQSISGLAGSISDLRNSTDQQVAASVSQANSLIQQIVQLNPQIQHAVVSGDTASGLLDQRDTLVQQLSTLVGIQTTTQADGRMFIATSDGVQLVGDNYSQLTYQPSFGSTFSPISVQTISASSGQPIGTSQTFDSHIQTGQLRGLLDMRDGTLVDIGTELGSLAQTVQQAFNKVHNANAAVPPPTTLDGRQTGLLSTDSLNFTGATTIGITDSNGTLLHKIAVNFSGGTLSVDGGPSTAIGGTIGSFTTALNTALGANGSANFTDGVLTVSATGSNGVVISDDAATPSSRAGTGFSQFFGLNDLYQSSGNSILTTGLTAADASGLAPGGSISLLLKGPQGQRVGETTVPVTGTTIGSMITALNGAFTGKATFALDANGQLQVTPAPGYSGYDLEITQDTTQRGTTGESFSSLFGLGISQQMAEAQNFSLTPDLAGAPQRLAFAKPTLDSTTALASAVVTPGDNRGLLALQDLINQTQSFAAAGSLPARNVKIGDYTSAFYQDVASRSTAIDSSKTSQDTRLTLAQQSQSQKEGVNLDEELSKMMTLQQAYNAGARLLQVAQQLYDQLLQAVGV